MMRRERRNGLTLFEVVISLAIFLAAVVALWNLANSAANRASETQLSTQASLMCQSKLAEAMVGIQQFGSVDWQPIADVDNFFWRMDATQDSVDGLYLVQVSVKQEANGIKNAECSLTQYALAPQNRGSTMDQAATANTPANPNPTTTDPADSGNSSGSGASGAAGAAGGGATKMGGGGTKTGGGGRTGGTGGGGMSGGGTSGGTTGGKNTGGGNTGGGSSGSGTGSTGKGGR